MAVSWEELVKREPRLDELLREAQKYKPSPGFCAREVWYGPHGLKRRLRELVGYDRSDDDPVLSTSEAYDVAYRRI